MRVFVALVVAVTAAHAVANSVVLERVEVAHGSLPSVRLTLSAPVVPRTHVIEATDVVPRRLAVDLPGAILGAAAQRVTGQAGDPILRVRSGQLDATTARVVIELSGPAPFTIATDGRLITVNIGNVGMAPGRSAPPPLQSSAGKAAPAEPSRNAKGNRSIRRPSRPDLFLDYDGITPLPRPPPVIAPEPQTPRPTPLGP